MIRLPRKVIVVLAAILILLVAVTFYLQYQSSQNSGPWVSTTPYPLNVNGTTGVLGQACVASSSTVYCVGGEDATGQPRSSVYYAHLSSTGIGNWTEDTNGYPNPIMFASCVSYSGYVYCVGGTQTSTGNDSTAAYFAPIESGGLGNWTATSPYPITTDSMSCVPSSGYVFCMGGENETAGTATTATDSSSVWYAGLSSSGIGAWSRTTTYPSGVFFPECSSLGGFIYCTGGQGSSGNPISSTYYAPVSSEGLGQWTATSSYPVPTIAQSCTTVSTALYCVGGLGSGGSSSSGVYYSGLSPSGVGGWQQGGSYPVALSTDCVAYSGYLYCIGGYDPSTGPTAASYFVAATTSSSSST